MGLNVVRGAAIAAAVLAGCTLGACGSPVDSLKVGQCVTMSSDPLTAVPGGVQPQITGTIDCTDPHEQGKVVTQKSDGACPTGALLFGTINSAGNVANSACIDPNQ